jgi:thioredoxin 1
MVLDIKYNKDTPYGYAIGGIIMVNEINDTIFNDEVIASSTTVVVDFWATWCGPCKMLGPVMDEISDELDNQAKFVKINVDENPVTSNTYKIASIPSVLIFKDGEIVDTMVGFRPKQAVKQIIERHV